MVLAGEIVCAHMALPILYLHCLGILLMLDDPWGRRMIQITLECKLCTLCHLWHNCLLAHCIVHVRFTKDVITDVASEMSPPLFSCAAILYGNINMLFHMQMKTFAVCRPIKMTWGVQAGAVRLLLYYNLQLHIYCIIQKLCRFPKKWRCSSGCWVRMLHWGAEKQSWQAKWLLIAGCWHSA